MRQVVRNATVFDSAAGVLRPGSTVVIEGERIAAVTQETIAVHDAARQIDANGDSIVIFRDTETSGLSVLYRRNGELTLVETET